MGIILNAYKKNLLGRFDKDEAVPYYSYKDFPGLQYEEKSFLNSINVRVSYFYYYREGFIENKIVIFLPGIGPGHTAYLKEINELTLTGYKVLTLDYTGCGASKGEELGSLNRPTRDVNDLLMYLDIKEEIMLVGHSLGAYTALNVINEHDEIKTAVIISGFVSLYNQIKFIVKLSPFAWRLCRYEKKAEPDYYNIDNFSYLSSTKDSILFIHSKDDNVVGYKSSTAIVESLNNKNIKFLITDKKRHNPTYTTDAVKYMTDTFSEYSKLIKNKTLDTLAKRKYFLSQKSIDKMTEMDKNVISEIENFLKNY